MSAFQYAEAQPFRGIRLPKRWCATDSPARVRRAGDAIVLAFLVAQALDGVLTYVGVVTYGLEAEGNPLIGTLMANFGLAAGLISAKLVAGFLGICLHLREVHAVIGWLTAFYVTVAIVPWLAVLFLTS